MTEAQPTPVSNLLERARSGDDAAREALFEKCRNYVAVVARLQVESWLQAKVDASDIVQQTLLEAHRGFEQFRGASEGEWLGWLRQILTNNTRDFVRHYKGTQKRATGREIPIRNADSEFAGPFAIDLTDPGASPSQIVIQHENEIELADAMSRLAEDHQEVILLRNVQRLPFAEIGHRMQRSGPAVQMLWMRAIKSLQASLKTTSQN